MEYHVAPVEEVARALHTAPTGLSQVAARQLLSEQGPNQLTDSKKKTIGQLLLHQLADVMILVLLAAAAISIAVGEANSAYVILAIVVLNAVIGFGQEYRADQALEALQQMAASHAKCCAMASRSKCPPLTSCPAT
jgi:Ca2+-transporting ATPase